MKAYLAMKKWKDMTDEEFDALPEEERRMAVATAGMSDDERADYLARTEWLDGQLKRAEEWDKTMEDLFGQPKKQQRQKAGAIVLAIVLTATALVVVLVVSG